MNHPAVSKAEFKAHALEIFRRVEASGESILITDRGRPVLRLEPYYGDDEAIFPATEGTLVRYERPTEPVGEEDWEALRSEG